MGEAKPSHAETYEDIKGLAGNCGLKKYKHLHQKLQNTQYDQMQFRLIT